VTVVVVQRLDAREVRGEPQDRDRDRL